MNDLDFNTYYKKAYEKFPYKPFDKFGLGGMNPKYYKKHIKPKILERFKKYIEIKYNEGINIKALNFDDYNDIIIKHKLI